MTTRKFGVIDPSYQVTYVLKSKPVNFNDESKNKLFQFQSQKKTTFGLAFCCHISNKSNILVYLIKSTWSTVGIWILTIWILETLEYLTFWSSDFKWFGIQMVSLWARLCPM